MATEADKKGLALIREVENRVVWLACFLVRASSGSLSSSAAKLADEGLDNYQSRFSPITPDDLPAG